MCILFASLGLTSGCQTKTWEFINDCFNGSSPWQDAYEKACKEQEEKERLAREEERKERIARLEYTKQFKEEFPEMFSDKSPETAPLDEEDEFVAWYQSLTDQQKKIMIIELDNQQLQYDVNHGFDSDGYSSYYNSNQYYADRTNLMYKWKASWDKTSEPD